MFVDGMCTVADGTDTEILNWLDDHSRYALSVTAHQPVTGTIVSDTITETARKHKTIQPENIKKSCPKT